MGGFTSPGNGSKAPSLIPLKALFFFFLSFLLSLKNQKNKMKTSLKISWGCHPTAHRNEGTRFPQVISGITAPVFLFCLKQSGGDIGHINPLSPILLLPCTNQLSRRKKILYYTTNLVIDHWKTDFLPPHSPEILGLSSPVNLQSQQGPNRCFISVGWMCHHRELQWQWLLHDMGQIPGA